MVIGRLLIVVLVALVIFDPHAAFGPRSSRPPSAPAAPPRRSTSLATRPPSTRCARRQRRRRRGRRRGRARRDRAVLVRHRRRRLHGRSAPRAGRSRRSTAARRRRRRCGPTRSGRTACRSPFDDARFSGISRRRARHRRELGRRAAALRHQVAGQGARSPASRSRATASWSTRRSSTRPRANVDCFDDVPSTAAHLPRPGRHAARRRHRCSATRTWRARTS